jgi:hypothetical protein
MMMMMMMMMMQMRMRVRLWVAPAVEALGVHDWRRFVRRYALPQEITRHLLTDQRDPFLSLFLRFHVRSSLLCSSTDHAPPAY